jgi:hypothetical protein
MSNFLALDVGLWPIRNVYQSARPCRSHSAPKGAFRSLAIAADSTAIARRYPAKLRQRAKTEVPKRALVARAEGIAQKVSNANQIH